jgi:hypothetical protein
VITMLSVSVYPPHINFRMAEQIFMKLPHQSLCLYVYPSIVARQLLGKNFTAATNTHVTVEELLDVSFSMRSVSY